jgi:hypothetical protein
MKEKQYPKKKFGHRFIKVILPLYCRDCRSPLKYEQRWIHPERRDWLLKPVGNSFEIIVVENCSCNIKDS